jgi:predicted nuclease of predicted toxin-antitoxin system
MKFLVDAHLPPGLCAVLRAAGHDVLHTSDLPAQNRTADRVLNELSLRDQRVVVTKDLDFYHSHVLRGEPWKLLLVLGTGANSADALLNPQLV